RGQAYNLTVPFAGRPVTAEAIAQAERAFEQQHRRLYDYTPTVTETEIVTLRLRALARIPDIDWAATDQAARPVAAEQRRVWSQGWRIWQVVARDALELGDRLAAETIVEQEDATVVVPAGWAGLGSAGGTLFVAREEGPDGDRSA